MMKLLLALALLIAPALAPPTFAHQEDGNCLKIASYADVASTLRVTELLKEAYGRANICATIIEMPLARAALMLLKGEVDANAARSDSFVQQNRDAVIAIPTALVEFRQLIISRAEDNRGINSLDHIKGKTVGLRIGNTILSDLIAKSGGIPVRSVDLNNLHSMLNRRRIDAFVVEDLVWQHFAKTGTADISWVRTSSPVSVAPVYHVVHQRHAALVPALDAEIKKMAVDGLFARALATGSLPLNDKNPENGRPD